MRRCQNNLTWYGTLLVNIKFNKYNEDKHKVERVTGLFLQITPSFILFVYASRS